MQNRVKDTPLEHYTKRVTNLLIYFGDDFATMIEDQKSHFIKVIKELIEADEVKRFFFE